MKLSVSSRDKKLLMWTSIAALLTGFWQFAYRPLLDEREELLTAVEEAEAARGEQILKIRALDLFDETAAAREEALREAAAPYYDLLETHEMDGIVTGLLLKHGLFPESLRLEEGRPELPEPYRRAPEEDGEEGTAGFVQTATAVLRASGPVESWNAFLDEVVNEQPGLRVVRFDRTDEAYLPEGQSEVQIRSRIDCTLEIYMCGEEAGTAGEGEAS